MSKGWDDFLWVKNGEGGGSREGYTPQIFDEMEQNERNKAREILIRDSSEGDSFAIKGLPMLLGKDSIPILNELAKKENLSALALATIYGELAKLTHDYKYIYKLIDFLFEDDPNTRSTAITYLEDINLKLTDGLAKINQAMIKENRQTSKQRLANIIVNQVEGITHIKLDNLQKIKLSSQIKNLENPQNIEETIKHFFHINDTIFV